MTKRKKKWKKINTLQTYANSVAYQHLTFDMHVHNAVHNQHVPSNFVTQSYVSVKETLNRQIALLSALFSLLITRPRLNQNLS